LLLFYKTVLLLRVIHLSTGVHFRVSIRIIFKKNIFYRFRDDLGGSCVSLNSHYSYEDVGGSNSLAKTKEWFLIFEILFFTIKIKFGERWRFMPFLMSYSNLLV
jgi:hypothetical protein